MTPDVAGIFHAAQATPPHRASAFVSGLMLRQVGERRSARSAERPCSATTSSWPAANATAKKRSPRSLHPGPQMPTPLRSGNASSRFRRFNHARGGNDAPLLP